MTLLEALRHARTQCQVRYAQLAGCRTCGLEQEKFRGTVEHLDALIAIESAKAPEVLSVFRFSKSSLDRLATVHPDLQRVAHRALLLSPVDFSIAQGRRTVDEQMRLYGRGRTSAQCRAVGVPGNYAKPAEAKVTWTLNSNHLSGNAIDVAPFIAGRLEYDDSGKLGLWPKIADAFKRSALEMGVPIVWGGDWTKTIDRPHFEIVR